MTGIGTVKALNDIMHERFQNPIECTRGTITIASSDDTQTGTGTIFVTGELVAVTYITPEMEGSDSTNMELKDELGVASFATGTQAEKATIDFRAGGTNIGGGGGTLDRDQVYLWGTTEVVMTAEGTQSADVDISYMILTKR